MAKKSIVLTFGRFNPPTAGHHLLAQRVMQLASETGAEHRIYGSRSQDPKKNPLDPQTKAKHMATVLGTPHVHVSDDIISPFHALKHVSDQGYEDVTVVTGSDRESIFDKVPHYQKKGDFKFKNFKIVTAGEKRGEKAKGLAGMSATKQRQAAGAGDFEAFRMGLPGHVTKAQARSIFRDVRRGMNLKEDYVTPSSFTVEEIEDFANSQNLLTETVSAQGRMRLARSARRTAKRRAFLRKLRKRRRRNVTQLKKRASSQVRRTLRKKLFRGNWKKLSYAQRSKIDTAIDKRRPILNRMVKQILPKVISGESKRLSKLNRTQLKESPLFYSFNTLLEQKSQQEKRRDQNQRKRKQRAKDSAIMQSNPFAGQVAIVQDEDGNKMLIRKTSLQANHTILVAPDKMTQGAAQELLQDEDFVNTPTSIELFGKVEGADSGKEKRDKKAEAQETQKNQAVQAIAAPPKPPPTRTTGKSTFPDSDHAAVDMEFGVVAAFNEAAGIPLEQQIKEGLISQEAAEYLMNSSTLGESAQRTLEAISEQLSTNYPGANFAAIHYGSTKSEKLSKFWTNYGGVDNTPKSDILFRDINSGQVVGVSVKCGPSQLMSGKAGGEATATIYAALEGMDKRKLEPKVKKRADKLIQSLKNLINSPRRTAGGDISDFLTGGELEGQDKDILKFDKLHKEAKKELQDLLVESKDFRKAFVYEALTGMAKFDTGNPKKISPAVAQYVLSLNKDGTETSLSQITPEYADKVADALSFVIRFKSSSVKSSESEAIRKKTGRKVYSYWSVISMVLNPKKIAKESFSHSPVLNNLITEDTITSIETSQLLDQLKNEIGGDVYSLMQFLEVEPEMITTQDIDFTQFGKVESGFYNVIKIGNTEHEIPVEKNIQEFYISFAKNFIAEKRNYRKEYDNYQGTEKQKKNRAKRNKVNRLMKRLGRIRKGDGRDVDHKDGNPNNNSMKNLRVVNKSHNRSKK